MNQLSEQMEDRYFSFSTAAPMRLKFLEEYAKFKPFVRFNTITGYALKSTQ